MKEIAVFAGGCFWCMQHHFDQIEGVLETTVGYSGGNLRNPTYEKVLTETTGHVEAIKITFNSKIVAYKELLIEFLSIIDPTDEMGQFCDIGSQYEPKIFYINDDQKRLAKGAIDVLERFLMKKPTVQILKLKNFYPAESYHQKYSEKQPKLYNSYFVNSGRIYHFSHITPKIKEFLKENLK